jgi:hypothetical protein
VADRAGGSPRGPNGLPYGTPSVRQSTPVEGGPAARRRPAAAGTPGIKLVCQPAQLVKFGHLGTQRSELPCLKVGVRIAHHRFGKLLRHLLCFSDRLPKLSIEDAVPLCAG